MFTIRSQFLHQIFIELIDKDKECVYNLFHSKQLGILKFIADQKDGGQTCLN
jgi:hypothetical protein